jgi:hypothetical protein
MSENLLQLLLWLSPVALELFWAYRLWDAGLVKRYKALFAYLILGAAFTVASYVLYVSEGLFGHSYEWFWIIVRPLVWVLFFLVVYECYGRMVEGYGAVKRLGQLVMYGAIGSVAAVIAYLLIANPYLSTERNELRRLWLVQEQSVYLSVAACIFALLVFQRFFELNVLKNVRLVFSVFGLYFAGTAALLMLRSLLGAGFGSTLDISVWALYLLCMAVGAFQFSQAGETIAVDPRLAGSESYTRTLRFAQERLDSVNLQLMRTLTK